MAKLTKKALETWQDAEVRQAIREADAQDFASTAQVQAVLTRHTQDIRDEQQVQNLHTFTLKGMVKKPEHPVSLEDMREAVQNAVCEDFRDELRGELGLDEMRGLNNVKSGLAKKRSD